MWSPDASRIGFVSGQALNGTDSPNTNLTQNIWVIKADGTGQTPLTKFAASGASSSTPAWAPDGSRILFSSTRNLDGTDSGGTGTNIWVMNSDGTSPTHLTPYTKANAVSPVLSAAMISGQFQVAFSSTGKLDGSDNPNANNTGNIWRMNADGTSQNPLTMLTALFAFTNGVAWQP